MATIQGKEPCRLSPLLTRILRQGDDAELARTALGVGDLSRLFTKEREALGRNYLKDPALRAAYLAYFLPVNLSKIQLLLEELPEDWHWPSTDRPLRILDLGTGPGTGALAVLDWLHRHGVKSAFAVMGIDASVEALGEARRLWNDYSMHAAIRDATLALLEGNFASTGRWRHDIARNAPYDLIIIANCLNELYGQTVRALTEKSALVGDILGLLAPHGTLMLVEPALRETSRQFHQLRDQLLHEQRCTVYSPCLHEHRCPALINEDDWCHEERAWVPPLWVQRIDRQIGLIKDALKFSYLLLRTDGRSIAERSPDTFRMVSDLRKLKGDARAWLCNELGRCEVGRLDRAGSAANAAWHHCQRGTIVRIESITRKEGASLSRIPADALVQIVRPT
jgi:ribosomal protein RSM22 (predicted rRNA methylase)